MNTVSQTFVADGNAHNIELGFLPDVCRIIDATARTELLYLADDTVNVNGLAIAVDGAKTKAADAAHGVAVLNGDKDTPKGLTLGASAAVNVNTHVIVVIASIFDN